MTTKSTTTQSGGIGIAGLLGVTFIVLKLCKVIDWSWWWVLAPFWIPLALVAVIFAVVIGLALFAKS